ncbi:type I methionyl aminopeptidase [Microgenomates group bacterium RBG_16_45_19]|nr:MAG: type I methionyl aminopeptidase [Microgenomates group bacterium RBG_16_45_19]
MVMSTASAYLDTFRQNGHRIATIRRTLVNYTQTQKQLAAIEALANRLIQKAGGEPAFKKVPGYRYATCISINDAIVHSPPLGQLHSGDLVTLDTGMSYHGTTSDTAVSFVIGPPTPFQSHFLNVGRRTLKKAIAAATVGHKVYHLAKTIQTHIEAAGFNVTRNLTGHGLGQTMHEPPPIPCFISKDPQLNQPLTAGMVLAIEVMYMAGNWPLKTDPDGWTMRTVDGSLSAVFEEDILITPRGPEVLTN